MASAVDGETGRPSLASVNRSLTCSLCKGYFINAMTLVRCMHSFCKSCIHRHLDTSNACPTCQQRVFRSRMDHHMMPDTTLQAIVYKAVPGLFASEMRRRRDFYESREKPTKSVTEKLALGEEHGFPTRNIFLEDDSISLVLEHRQDEPGCVKLTDRHLSCPAEVPVWVVIKFIRNKFSPPPSLAVHVHLEKKDINLTSRKSAKRNEFSQDDPADKDRLLLDPDLTLIDVCYIADYKFDAPLRLSFRFVQFDPTLPCGGVRVDSMTSIQQRKPSGRSVSALTNGRDSLKHSTVDYAKYRVDTKGIDMARGALLNGGLASTKVANGGLANGAAKSRTYSRATTASSLTPSLGQISSLGGLPLTSSLASCNAEATGDSTEEEEADNWDSNVSTTIDRTLTTQQQNGAHLSSPLATSLSAVGSGREALAKSPRTQGQMPSTHPLSAGPGRHSRSSGTSGLAATEDKSCPIVTRPQSLKIGPAAAQGPHPMQQLQVSSLDNRVAVPVGKQSAIGKHSPISSSAASTPKPSQRSAAGHRATGGGSTTASSAAAIAEGKPPKVLKIKLNTSPTTSETLTITSPTSARAARQTADKIIASVGSASAGSATSGSGTSPRPSRDYPVVTSIKIKPIPAPTGPVTRKSPSPPLNARDSRAAALDARKKRKLEEEARKLDEQKPVKSKKKTSAQPLINEVPFVPDQHTDLLSTQSFGWGSAAILWESQLRIPCPLIVPFTVSFARRERKLQKEAESKNRSLLVAKRLRSAQEVCPQDTFLESNFGLKKQAATGQQPADRSWRKRRLSSPPPISVKLPPPDFVPSPTLNAVLRAIAADNSAQSRDSSTENAAPTKPLSEKVIDPARSPGEGQGASDNDVDADVFRMEFPEACVAPPTAETLADSGAVGAAPEPATTPSSPSAPPSRCSSEVKFSISSILSDGVGQRKPPVPTTRPEPEVNPVANLVESYLSKLSEFFWAIESCEPTSRASLQAACADKKVTLIKILAILRHISLAVVPGQSDRVLELAAQIQRHLLDRDGISAPAAGPEIADGSKAARVYDVNRNQLPVEGVPPCGAMKPPCNVQPGTSITADLRAHLAMLCATPVVLPQVSPVLPQRKQAFQMQDILAKEVASVLKKMPSPEDQQKSAFELVTIKRSSSVSSLNTSDGSENFGDGELEPNRWEDVEAVPTARPWPGCTSEA